MDQPASEGLLGRRARIGYTSPPLTAEVFPREFYQIAPDGVTLVLATLAVIERNKAEVDAAYDASLYAAREMAAAGVDIVVLGGVPINLSRGDANAETLVRDLAAELKIPVTTSALAQQRAAKALGCRKVVVAQPYDDSQNARQSSYAITWGCEVLGAMGWGFPLNRFGSVPLEAALTMGRKLLRQHPDADTILMPSPHWPTVHAIEPLEREFGISVLSASQAAIWDALRGTGITDPIAGYGRLLREF